jgi:hypothetical protein
VVNAILEAIGFLLVVAAVGTLSVPLAMGLVGAGLILVANRPERAPTEQGSADARTPTLP